jgi:hypothetical protein
MRQFLKIKIIEKDHDLYNMPHKLGFRIYALEL